MNKHKDIPHPEDQNQQQKLGVNPQIMNKNKKQAELHTSLKSLNDAFQLLKIKNQQIENYLKQINLLKEKNSDLQIQNKSLQLEKLNIQINFTKFQTQNIKKETNIKNLQVKISSLQVQKSQIQINFLKFQRQNIYKDNKIQEFQLKISQQQIEKNQIQINYLKYQTQKTQDETKIIRQYKQALNQSSKFSKQLKEAKYNQELLRQQLQQLQKLHQQQLKQLEISIKQRLTIQFTEHFEQIQSQFQHQQSQLRSRLEEREQQLKTLKQRQNRRISQPPQNLLCPITKVIMKSPIILTTCSHTFEQTFIRQWLAKSPKCPLCNTPTSIQNLSKNYVMASVIRGFA